jgi:hypothetical protein
MRAKAKLRYLGEVGVFVVIEDIWISFEGMGPQRL